MLNSIRSIVLFAITAAALAPDRGTIRGTVTDPTGAAVPEAVVTVKNVNTGLTQIVKTSADGVYSIPYLPVGDYTVTTDKAGFRKALLKNFNMTERVHLEVRASASNGLTRVVLAAPNTTPRNIQLRGQGFLRKSSPR
jgi:hypothetical protein